MISTFFAIILCTHISTIFCATPTPQIEQPITVSQQVSLQEALAWGDISEREMRETFYKHYGCARELYAKKASRKDEYEQLLAASLVLFKPLYKKAAAMAMKAPCYNSITVAITEQRLEQMQSCCNYATQTIHIVPQNLVGEFNTGPFTHGIFAYNHVRSILAHELGHFFLGHDTQKAHDVHTIFLMTLVSRFLCGAILHTRYALPQDQWSFRYFLYGAVAGNICLTIPESLFFYHKFRQREHAADNYAQRFGAAVYSDTVRYKIARCYYEALEHHYVQEMNDTQPLLNIQRVQSFIEDLPLFSTHPTAEARFMYVARRTLGTIKDITITQHKNRLKFCVQQVAEDFLEAYSGQRRLFLIPIIDATRNTLYIKIDQITPYSKKQQCILL